MVEKGTSFVRQEPVPCDGEYPSGCGCFDGVCYKYLTIPGGWMQKWCFTQCLGVEEPMERWAKCRLGQHTECSHSMTCGDSNSLESGNHKPPNVTSSCTTTTRTTTTHVAATDALKTSVTHMTVSTLNSI